MLEKGLTTDKSTSFRTYYYRLIFIRRLTETLITALLIAGGQQFLIQTTFMSALWPTTGVGLSALFLRGNFMLLGIFLGSALSYLYFHFPLWASLTLSGVFCIYLFLIRFIALRTIGPIAPLAKLSILVKFIILVSILSALHITLFLQLIAYILPVTPTFFNGYLGWLGQINGILCLTPLCLIFDPFVLQRYFNFKKWIWWVGALILISVHLLYFVFWGMPTLPFALLSLAVVGCYAYCFGQVPTCIVLLGISVPYLNSVLIAPQPFVFILQKNIQISLSFFTLTVILSLAIATTRSQLKAGRAL